MANPTVDDIVGKVSLAAEQWFDRWRNALERSRQGLYTFHEFAEDVANTWVDGMFVSVYPVSQLGGMTVTKTAPFPIVRFTPLTRADKTRLVEVPELPNVMSMKAEDLKDASKANVISNGLITVAKNSASQNETYVKVSIKISAATSQPSGLYTGNIVDTGTSTAIARIEVELP